MTTKPLNKDLSLNCNQGKHDCCDGKPPSKQMAQFLPEHLRTKRCACSCHKVGK